MDDQIQESLAPSGADPSGAWRACKSNHSACDASQMKFLQGYFGYTCITQCKALREGQTSYVLKVYF